MQVRVSYVDKSYLSHEFEDIWITLDNDGSKDLVFEARQLCTCEDSDGDADECDEDSEEHLIRGNDQIFAEFGMTYFSKYSVQRIEFLR